MNVYFDHTHLHYTTMPCSWMFCRHSTDEMSKKLCESRSMSAGLLPSTRRPQTAFSTLSTAARSTQPAVPPSASSGRKSVPPRRQLLDPVVEERAWTEKLHNEKRRNAVWYEGASIYKVNTHIVLPHPFWLLTDMQWRIHIDWTYMERARGRGEVNPSSTGWKYF